MSKNFRPWKIDERQLLPPSVQDYVAKNHMSRLVVRAGAGSTGAPGNVIRVPPLWGAICFGQLSEAK